MNTQDDIFYDPCDECRQYDNHLMHNENGEIEFQCDNCIFGFGDKEWDE